jgi:hypothetical protein
MPFLIPSWNGNPETRNATISLKSLRTKITGKWRKRAHPNICPSKRNLKTKLKN